MKVNHEDPGDDTEKAEAEVLAERFLDLAALNRRALLDSVPAAIDAAVRKLKPDETP